MRLAQISVRVFVEYPRGQPSAVLETHVPLECSVKGLARSRGSEFTFADNFTVSNKLNNIQFFNTL